MCYRPLLIKNNSLHFSPETQPFQFVVPCGKCEACRNQRKTEWFARSYYHWQAVKSAGGCSFFYTLTFNSGCIPSVDGKLCFDKSLVQKAMKRLRDRLLRKYGVKMTFLLTSEYGDLFARPHHHVLFFLDKMLMPWQFFKIVQDSWQYGFVYAGKDGGLLNNCSGILYVTKYIVKDPLFDVAPLFRHFVKKWYSTFLADIPEGFDLPLSLKAFSRNKSRYLQIPFVRECFNAFNREFRSFIPFNLHSNFLGASAIGLPTRCFEDSEELLIPRGNSFDTIPLPRYIQRVLWYDRVPNEHDGKKTLFRLNERGIAHKCGIIEKKVQTFEHDIQAWKDSFTLTNSRFELLKDRFSFETASDMVTYVRHCDLNLHYLAIYKYLIRHRVNFEFGRESKDLFTNWKQIYCEWVSSPVDSVSPPLRDLNHNEQRYLRDSLFNYTDFYRPYELFLQIYEAVCRLDSEQYFDLKLEKTLNARRLRDLNKLNHLIISKQVV